MTAPIRTSQSEVLFARAHAVIPGGVNSPVRAFGAVGGTPPFMASGQGPYITDVDGTSYVDLVCAWGPMILGHRHPAVAAAIADTASRGWSYGAPTGVEVELATEIAARVGPVEQVRLVSSGTEATMTAVRLARAATGRDKIVKFAGCYHGHADAFLVAAGSGVATLGLPDSPGVPTGVSADTIVVPYNTPDAVREAFAQHGEQIACVITEACPANMGVVPPEPGFNAFLREICTAHGALLIVDEVLTGFRVSSSGWYGLEAVDADLMTFGKVIGGGLPAAAIGGRADLMGRLAPLGPVYQAGTLSGNPLACAAGLATLRHLDAAAYAAMDAASTLLRQALTSHLAAAGVPHRIQAAGSLFSLFFTDQPDRPITTYTEARQHDGATYRAFFHAMLDRGVYLPPSPREAWMVSAALDSTALSRVLYAIPAAATAAAAVTRQRHLPGIPPATRTAPTAARARGQVSGGLHAI